MMYQDVISRSGIRMKVVERRGTSLKRQLQTSNPFKQRQCGRERCFVCTTGGKGDCNTESITYEIRCEGNCNVKNVYKGESAESAFTRGQKHITDLNARNENNSPLWRHCKEVHGGLLQKFVMSVTGTFRNDPMLRQITEAVQIENTSTECLMNTRAEWNMTRVPRATIT